MISDFIKIFRQAPSDIGLYFSYISENIDLITDKDTLINKIETPNNDLFYHRLNIENIFYKGSFSDMVGIFYHYYQIDWSFLGLEVEDENYISDFSVINKSPLFSYTGIEVDKILSIDSEQSILKFLFLYFMPNINRQDLCFIKRFKCHLIASPQISLNNFKFLIKLFSEDGQFDSLCLGNHLNNQMIEASIQNSSELVGYSQINWNDFLPIEKIKILLDYGCTFKDFIHYQTKNTYNLAPKLAYELQEIEAKIKKERLEEILEIKENSKKTVKL